MVADVQAAAAAWRDEGWVLVEGLVPPTDIDAARSELTVPRGDDREAADRSRVDHGGAPTDGPAFRTEQFSGHALFPLQDAPALNRLVVHPAVVAFAEAALGSTDIRLYQARLWTKVQGAANYEQPLHRDLNHSLVPTRSEPGWWHLECFLYLSDVDAGSGPPRLVPRARADRVEPAAPFPVEPDEAPELYAAEIGAPGPAGSLLAYRSDVWHRGTDITRPGAVRHVLVVAFKLAGQDWIGYDAHPPLSINRDFVAFANGCTPRELELFGVPPPGHRFWTSETVDAMRRIYPRLDLGPWRAAL